MGEDEAIELHAEALRLAPHDRDNRGRDNMAVQIDVTHAGKSSPSGL